MRQSKVLIATKTSFIFVLQKAGLMIAE